jgi:hypothetical protein
MNTQYANAELQQAATLYFDVQFGNSRYLGSTLQPLRLQYNYFFASIGRPHCLLSKYYMLLVSLLIGFALHCIMTIMYKLFDFKSKILWNEILRP